MQPVKVCRGQRQVGSMADEPEVMQNSMQIVHASQLRHNIFPAKKVSHLHCVIYAHACCDRTSWRVDEQLDVLQGVSFSMHRSHLS